MNKILKKILFLLGGKPAAGKDTFAKILRGFTPTTIIVLGDLCRCEIKRETEVWKKAHEHIQTTGRTAWPDDLIVKMVTEHIRINQLALSHIFLNAFPYSMGQTNAIRPIMKEFGFNGLVSIEVSLDDEECIRRAKERGRYDDEEIHRRLEDYYNLTEPALDAVMNLSDQNLRVQRIVFPGDNMIDNAPYFCHGLTNIYNLP